MINNEFGRENDQLYESLERYRPVKLLRSLQTAVREDPLQGLVKGKINWFLDELVYEKPAAKRGEFLRSDLILTISDFNPEQSILHEIDRIYDTLMEEIQYEEFKEILETTNNWKAPGNSYDFIKHSGKIMKEVLLVKLMNMCLKKRELAKDWLNDTLEGESCFETIKIIQSLLEDARLKNAAHQLPANTKDIDLAPLVRQLSAEAVNELLDAAMEQIIALQGRNLKWDLPANTTKLCHRCGKLGCNPQSCPLRGGRGRSRTRDPVAKLCDRIKLLFYVASRSGPANLNSDQRNQKSSSHKQTPQSGLKFIYSSYELVKDVYEVYGNLRVVKNYWNELEKEFLDKDLDSLLNIDCRLNIIEKILEGASKKGDVCGIGWVIFNSINNIISEEHLRIIDNFEVLELEILAIITALMTVKEESKIQIYTDSLGFIKVLFIKRWNELFTKGNSMVN
ncbi:hypothetical protein RhiirC2_771028 [Rhizophagus irregularis]|uniref:RNase H type-1 domain-containing protein n=1 Tax=Rhizophagus irregularis TaxID=588596 RepID=A0A2N1NV36_9GLOM|nr:hypothetical protein RhiirC2_771028 [Rhizophagus irregularis]